MTTSSDIRIYVACLAAYNNGILHGAWIDADQDVGDIQAEIAAMLKASPSPGAEEWAIHDYEGFEGLDVSEYEGIGGVVRKAAFISEHGALGAAVADYYGGDLDDATRTMDEGYFGEYRTAADFAEEVTENTNDIPQSLRFYIDYDRMARDMELSGDIFTIETGFEEVHVFGCH